MWPRLDRPRPRLAIGVGIWLTIVVACVAPSHDDVTRAVPALLLVVPVIVAAVLGGRAPAFIIAAAATLAFSLALPPFGSLRIHLGEDVVALVVFIAVAFVASALVTTKMDTLHDVDDAAARVVALRVARPAYPALGDTRGRNRFAIGNHVRRPDAQRAARHHDRRNRTPRSVRREPVEHEPHRSGHTAADMQPVDVTELLERVTHRFERSGAHAIKLDAPAHLPFVRGDHTQLEQVVSNLLDNAVRHTPATARSVSSARGPPRAVAITVSDDGPGLPAAVRERLESGTPDRARGSASASCGRSCSCTAVTSPSPTGDRARH